MYGSYSRHASTIAAGQAGYDAMHAQARKVAAYVKEHDGIDLKTLHSLFGERACNLAVELRACYRATQNDVARYFTNA